MNGGASQFARVLTATFRPMVRDEAFASMDEANPFDQQEWLEWKTEQESEQ
jgi:hypothetical protein